MARESVSVATLGITDVLAFLSKFMIRFGKACAKGFNGLMKFIEELLQGAKNGAKAEDLAEEAKDIEEVIVKGQKPLSIYKIPTSVIRELQGIGIEIIGRAKDYLLKWKEKPIFKGDWQEVTDFWRKILKPKLGAGTGGHLEYLEILSRNVIAQEHEATCVAACLRQYSKDIGMATKLSEREIFDLAGVKEFSQKMDELEIQTAMFKIFKQPEIKASSYFRNINADFGIIAKDISKEGSWIAFVHPNNGQKHAVIVDKIIDSKVYIKDPWPLEGIKKGPGVEAIVSLEKFKNDWLRGGASCFKIIK